MQTRLGDPEILRDLRQRRLPLASHRDNVTTKLQRECLGHDDFLPARTNPHTSEVNQTGGRPDCVSVADEWLSSQALRPRSFGGGGHRRLAVELRSLRFGEHVAENEVQSLPTYFVETSAFDDIVRGRTAIFVGRKGTGKSANMYLAAAELQRDPKNHVVVIKPAAYDFSALADLLGSLEGSLQDHTIDAIWRFVILYDKAWVVNDEI